MNGQVELQLHAHIQNSPKWESTYNVFITSKIYTIATVSLTVRTEYVYSSFLSYGLLNCFGAIIQWSLGPYRPLRFIHKQLGHDDVTKWKHFPLYWRFIRGIHRSPVIPLTKASDAELWFSWSCSLNKPLSKHSWGWWFETRSRSLWRHYNGIHEPWRRLGDNFRRCLNISQELSYSTIHGNTKH